MFSRHFEGWGGRRFARGDHGPQRHPHGDDPRHGHRHERGDHRGGRMGRFFEHGDLRLVVLQLIAERPRHGYEIIKAIEERVGGTYTPSPGVVYPTLTLLEELGYVVVRSSDGPKKLHEITPEGQAYLDGNRGAVDALLARMDLAGQDRGAAAPQIFRAMANLKLALRMRMQRGGLTDEQAAAVAAAIDAAAVAVERT